MQILLDTNFLMAPAQFSIDIYEKLNEHKLFTLDLCIKELKELAKKKGKTGFFARLGLELAKKKGLKTMHTKEKRADIAVICCAVRCGCAVATNDKTLMKLLKEKNITVFRLRQKKYITDE